MPVIDRLRRRGALSAAVLLLAAPALASCGFDYATDRVNTIAPGANDRSGDVKVLGAVVIAQSEGSGVFVATLTNSSDDAVSLTDLTGGSDEGSATLAVASDSQSPIEVPAGGRVSLIEEGGVPVEGDFAVGDFVPVTLTFDNGQTSTLDTNVVRACYQYSPEKLGELEFPESSSPAEPSESESAAPEGTEESEGEAHEPDAYSCDSYESEVWPSGGEPNHGGGEH